MSPELDDELAEFFRLVWGAKGGGAEVAAARQAAAAMNPSEPGKELPEFAFVLDGKVVGYLGAVPVSFWNGRAAYPTYWLKGFMVHPDHRNGPVGFSLLKEALQVIGPSGAIAAAPAARRLFTALGFVECGAVPNFVSVLRPGRFLSLVDVRAVGSRVPQRLLRIIEFAQSTGAMRAVGGLAVVAQTVWRYTRSHHRAGDTIEINGGLPPSAELNAFWETARSGIQACAVRDGTYLPWRYHPERYGVYQSASVRDKDGQLVGLAIVRRPSETGDERLRGIKLAVLSDILFRRGDTSSGALALKGARQIATRMGADALLCSATSPDVKGALRRQAYLPMPANVFLLIRDPGGALGLPAEIDDWWVTRGDCKADDAF